MFDEIIPGAIYKCRDGKLVQAYLCLEKPDYQGGELILAQYVNEAGEPTGKGDDGVYCWRRSGPKPDTVSASWRDTMIAGHVPKIKSIPANLEADRRDLVECISHPRRQLIQLELF
jgi:hypothetical protein